MIETHHLDLDEARAIIAKDMLGEQPLPVGRASALRADRFPQPAVNRRTS